jgi:hypothetical protein
MRAAGPEWVNYKNYQEIKPWFLDKHGLAGKPLPAGWTKTDRAMLESFFYENHPKFSKDSLNTIRSHYPAFEIGTKGITGIRAVLFNRDWFFTLAVICFIAFYVLLVQARKGLVRYLMFICCCGLVVLLIACFLKIPFRVYYIITLLVWVFPLTENKHQAKLTGLIPKATSVALLVISVGLYAKELRRAQRMNSKMSKDVVMLRNKLNQLPDNATVIGGEGYWSFLSGNMFEPPVKPGLYERFYFQGWLMNMPPNEQKGKRLGIVAEPYKCIYPFIVDKPSVFILSNDGIATLLQQYMHENYRSDIEVRKMVPISDGAGFYQLIHAPSYK